MFTDTVFWRAASVLKRLRGKGVKKSANSCKSKWWKLKSTYQVVTVLKSKSHSGFVWDDEKGLGVTAETQLKWNKLVKSNEHFKPFATKGWPHYEAMERLMSSKTSDAYAHQQDTQPPPVHESVEGEATLPFSAEWPPSPPPFDDDDDFPMCSPSNSPALSKHKSSPFEDRSPASSENHTTTTAREQKEAQMNRINHTFEEITGSFYRILSTLETSAQTMAALMAALAPALAPASSLAPAPAPAPAPPTPTPLEKAFKRLAKDVKHSREIGDEWLSPEEVVTMIFDFQRDEVAAATYLLLHEKADASDARAYLRSIIDGS